MSSQPQKPNPPQAPPSSPETWITAAEAAAALHLSLRTVLSRAASGKLPAKIPNDIPFTYDGKPNYLFRLEALPQNAQLQYEHLDFHILFARKIGEDALYLFLPDYIRQI